MQTDILLPEARLVTRPLGATESMFAWVQRRFGALTLAFVCRITGELDEELLSHSFRDVVRADTHLSGVILNPASKRPQWSHYPGINPSVQSVPRQSESHWQDLMRSQLNQPFETTTDPFGAEVTGPLCSMMIVHDCSNSESIRHHELIFRIHHAVCDGRRFLVFLHRTLSLYQARLAGDTVEPQHFGPTRTMESQLPRWRRWAATGRLIRESLSGAFRSSGQPGPWDHLIVPDDSRCKVAFESFTAEESFRLVTRCREQQTTVNAALAAAEMLAFQETTGFQGNVSIQSSFDHPDMTMDQSMTQGVGTYSCSQTTWHRPDRYLFWELAKQYRRIQLKHGRSNFVVPFGYFQLARPFLRAGTKNGRFAKVMDVGLSNLGRAGIPTQYGNLHLTELYFASAQSRLAGTAVVNVATMRDHLSLTCVTPAHVPAGVEVALLRRMKERLIDELHDC